MVLAPMTKDLVAVSPRLRFIVQKHSVLRKSTDKCILVWSKTKMAALINPVHHAEHVHTVQRGLAE